VAAHLRIGGVAAILALALVLGGWPSPASAHRDIVLTVHTDGRGSIWVTAAWTDGHPVGERVGATLTATSATGERIGPAPLRQIGDAAGTLVYERTLGAGEWRVVAETGTPSIARCEADVRVADAAGQAERNEVRCAPDAAPTASTWNVPLTVLGGILTTAILVCGIMWARRRSRASPRGARR
jgi:hypothetical protein